MALCAIVKVLCLCVPKLCCLEDRQFRLGWLHSVVMMDDDDNSPVPKRARGSKPEQEPGTRKRGHAAFRACQACGVRLSDVNREDGEDGEARCKGCAAVWQQGFRYLDWHEYIKMSQSEEPCFVRLGYRVRGAKRRTMASKWPVLLFRVPCNSQEATSIPENPCNLLSPLPQQQRDTCVIRRALSFVAKFAYTLRVSTLAISHVSRS